MLSGLGFNPCFSGTTTQTIFLYALLILLIIVSILVFLEPLLRHFVLANKILDYIEFQSLFFWNHYLDSGTSLDFRLLQSVSILVFLEPLLRLTFQHLGQLKMRVSILVFLEPLLRQSFFHLNFSFYCLVSILVFLEPLLRLHLDRNFKRIFRVSILVFLEPLLRRASLTSFSQAPICFNPCFSGTTTQTYGRRYSGLSFRSFNPCFSGTTTQTSAIVPKRTLRLMFQSLFFWNHYLDEP